MGAVVSEMQEREPRQLDLFKLIEQWIFGPGGDGFNSGSDETLNAYFYVLAFDSSKEKTYFTWKHYLLIVTSHRLLLARDKRRDLILKAVINYNEISDMFFAPDFQLVKVSFTNKQCVYLNVAHKSLAPELVKVISANMERFKGEDSALAAQARAKLALPVGLHPQGLNFNEKRDQVGTGSGGASAPPGSIPSASAKRLKADDRRISIRNMLSTAFSDKGGTGPVVPGDKRSGAAPLTKSFSTVGMNRNTALLLTSQMARLTPAFKLLQSLSLQEPQLYSGQIDLLAVMTTLRARVELPAEERHSFLLDFQFPAEDCFGGLQKKLYKVDYRSPTKQVVALLCNKLKVKDGAEKYVLSTESGRILDRERSLSNYGLGILFLTWQLKIVRLPTTPSFYIVEVQLPKEAAFSGQQRKTIKIPSQSKIGEVVSILFEKLRLPNASEYILETVEHLDIDPSDLVRDHGFDNMKFSFAVVRKPATPPTITPAPQPAPVEAPPAPADSTPAPAPPEPKIDVEALRGEIESELKSKMEAIHRAQIEETRQQTETEVRLKLEQELRQQAQQQAEAELREKLERDIRNKMEEAFRNKLEDEIRQNSEAQIREKVEREVTEKVTREREEKLAAVMAQLAANRSSSAPRIGQRRSASLESSAVNAALNTETTDSTPTSTPPATPSLPSHTSTTSTTPTTPTTPITPSLPATDSSIPTPPPAPPKTEEQEKVSKIAERMQSLSVEKLEEIANMVMYLESEEKAKEEAANPASSTLTFIKLRTFGNHLKGQLEEGRSKLRSVSEDSQRPPAGAVPLLPQEDNQFMKMLMQRYASIYINPDDVEELGGSSSEDDTSDQWA